MHVSEFTITTRVNKTKAVCLCIVKIVTPCSVGLAYSQVPSGMVYKGLLYLRRIIHYSG